MVTSGDRSHIGSVAIGALAAQTGVHLPDEDLGALRAGKHVFTEKLLAPTLAECEEIAAAAVYLASDEAAYVTGQTLHVNGGMAMI